MLLAAREVQRRSFTLRRITDRHVRSLLREFFLAGWTVADVLLALDRKPAGRWRHDGAAAVDNVGAWVAYRLRAWRTTEGTVRRSPSTRAAAAHAENRARALARRETESRAQREIATNLKHAAARHSVMSWLRSGTKLSYDEWRQNN